MTTSVEIKPVRQGHDIIGAEVVIGENRYDVNFSMNSDTIARNIKDAAGVVLSTQQLMAVTRLSREQMENEANKVLALLKDKPAGTVAVCAMDMHAWINPALPDQLTISQQLDPSDISGEDIGLPITEVGALDTEELNDIAEQLRCWLKAPSYLQVDAVELAAVS